MKEVTPFQLAERKAVQGKLTEELKEIEETKEYQMSRELPSLQGIQFMVAAKDITELKKINAPSEVEKETILMFLILADSFGMEMHPKLR